MRRLMVILSLSAAGLLAAPGPALAQQDNVAKLEELNAKARERYKSKDYQGAIALFQQAYDIEPVPNLLYNIAKCHEKLKQWDEAIKNYNEFVISPDVDPNVRKETLAHIEELRKIKALEQAPSEDPTKAADPDQPPAKPQAPAGPDRSGAYIALGSGAGLLAAGLTFGLLAQGQQTAFDEATTSAERRQARDSGTTYALVADVGYGLGLIAVGVGAYLWVSAKQGADTPEPSPQTSLSPWLSPQGGGLLWQTSF